MTNQYKQALKILNIPQADYFSFNEDHQGRLQDALEDIIEGVPEEQRAGIAIIALGGPGLVDLDQKKSLPIIIGSIQSGLRGWQVYYPTNLHIFVKNHSTGSLWSFEPLVSMRRGGEHLLSSVGEPPEKIESLSISSEVKWIDLIEHSEGRITPGLISVTAISDDLISNTRPILIKSSTKKPDTKQTLIIPRSLQAKSYKEITLASKVGIPSTATTTGPIPIKVAIQVEDDQDIIVSKQNELYLSAHIILIKLDERPVIIPATVPVQKISTPGGNTVFNAVFQLDLKAASQNTLMGKYRIYIDSGKEFLGPYSIEITK